MDIARYAHEQIGKMAPFENYSDDVVNPLFIWYMKPEYDRTAKWTLYDLQAALQQNGWMVPAYTLPNNLQNYVVMRIVFRQGMSRDMTDMLLTDMQNAITEFEKLEYPTQTRVAPEQTAEGGRQGLHAYPCQGGSLASGGKMQGYLCASCVRIASHCSLCTVNQKLNRIIVWQQVKVPQLRVQGSN